MTGGPFTGCFRAGVRCFALVRIGRKKEKGVGKDLHESIVASKWLMID